MGGNKIMQNVKHVASQMWKPASKEETSDFQRERKGSVTVKAQKLYKNVTFEEFNLIAVIGRGTFGKVFLAEFTRNKQKYAIKSIRKDILIEYD